jgi:hypothetical protein
VVVAVRVADAAPVAVVVPVVGGVVELLPKQVLQPEVTRLQKLLRAVPLVPLQAAEVVVRVAAVLLLPAAMQVQPQRIRPQQRAQQVAVEAVAVAVAVVVAQLQEARRPTPFDKRLRLHWQPLFKQPKPSGICGRRKARDTR